MITRRRATAALAASGTFLRGIAHGASDPFFGSAQGVGVALDVATGQVLVSHRLSEASLLAVPPGSTLKPFSLLALLQAGKLSVRDTHPCSGQLKIGSRSYACAHPRMAAPLDLQTAIAYSCNEYVAWAATRFAPGELASVLARFGFGIKRVSGVEANQLQALGEERVETSALQLANAYRRLALDRANPLIEGLEGAVAFGTAQKAQVAGVTVAGKTGTAARRFAWFAGFAPSRAPKVVVAVLVQGRAGGADAAPIAGKILSAYFEGKL